MCEHNNDHIIWTNFTNISDSASNRCYIYIYIYIYEGPGWLNELDRWI